MTDAEYERRWHRFYTKPYAVRVRYMRFIQHIMDRMAIPF